MSHLSTLQDMLSYARPYGSDTEHAFRGRYLLTLAGAITDAHGNIHVCTDDTSETLWSAHTDTVHRVEGRQTTHYNPDNGHIKLSKRSKRYSSCLGADDTVGCFLMREMILAGVPGYYIFHYGEESGGIGSRALAAAQPELFAKFKRAIALDRGGTKDVITSQYSQETASETFAYALGALLSKGYTPHAGLYTDTYEYAHLIPECSNLSVGYYLAHTSEEHVDTRHVMWLLSRLLTCDFSTLPTERNPEDMHAPVCYDWQGWSTPSQLRLVEKSTLDLATIEAMSDDELDAALNHAEWIEDWPMCRALETEVEARIQSWRIVSPHDPTDPTDYYLDSTYADVQRALYRAQKANYGDSDR